MGLKRTPLYDMHIKYDGKIVDFAGYELPITYKGIKEEHFAVRKNVGIFDVSHMGEIIISGNEAVNFINDLVTNDISNMIDGQIIYSPMCYENGGTVDDILVYRKAEKEFMLVVNGSNVSKDFRHIIQYKDEYDIEVDNQSDFISQIAVQGPKAKEVLSDLVTINLEELKYYYFKEAVNLGGIYCLLSRTGYTGEDGFEIYVKKEDAIKSWEMLIEKGKDYNMQPCGLGCRDTLRFEAGMPLYGNELSKDINPIEAGLKFFVKLDKEKFLGKEALKSYLNSESKRKLVGFKLLGKGIPRHGYSVEDEKGNIVGNITTGYLSPTLEESIGFALIEDRGQKIGDAITISIRKKKVKAEIISKKFLKRKGDLK